MGVRRRQGGCSVLYRKVNFNLLFTSKDNYQLVRSEYDPNRSSFIGLVYNYNNQKFNYILLPEGLAVNELILNSSEESFKRKPGFRSYLDYFPLGSLVHNISLCLPSGEERLVHKFCKATLGTVANIKKSIKKKNAGWARRMGNRPSVRGVAMNPIDHPHGGGEGRTSGGRCSVSPWGKLTIGKPTVSK